MKKVLLSVFAILTFATVSAQKKGASKAKTVTKTAASSSSSSEGFEQGSIFISGGIGISNTSQGDASSTNFSFKPQGGYFVTDNIAVGLAIGYDNKKTENVNIVKESTFSIGGFGRYYFTPDEKFSFYGEAGLGYFSNNTETIPAGGGGSTTSKGSGFQIGVAPGISYFLSDHIAIETSVGVLGYKTQKADDVPGAKAQNTFDLKLDVSDIKFGILYKF